MMECKKVRYGRTWWKRHHKKDQAENRPIIVDNDQDIIRLQQWMHKEGYMGCSLKPAIFSNTGRGLMTTKNISPGDTLISIPESLLITTDTVLNSDLGSMIVNSKVKLNPVQVIVLFLIVEHHKGRDSSWEHYLSVVPKEYTTPHYFSQREISCLNDLVKLKAQESVDNVFELYKSTLNAIKVLNYNIGDASLNDILTYDEFRWAWCAVNSRCVFVNHISSHWLDTTTQKNDFALAPYLDLLNHSSSSKVVAGFNFANRCYEIKTLNTYSRYDQVFIRYGQHSNVNLFLDYGFVLPDNEFSVVPVSTGDVYTLCKSFSQLVNMKEKLKYLDEKELLHNLGVSLNGASWKLKKCILIISADTGKNGYSFRKSVYDSSNARLDTCKVLMKTLLEQKLENAMNEFSSKSFESNNEDSQVKNFESIEATMSYKAVIIDILNSENVRILRKNIDMLLTNKEYFTRD